MLSDVSKIPGFLYDDEPEWLYSQAKEAPGLIVEVGSYMGKSTVCLAQGALDGHGGPVLSFDHHSRDRYTIQDQLDGHGGPVLSFDPQYIGNRPTYEQLLKNLKEYGVRDVVQTYVCRSEEVRRFVGDGEAGLIFIDGDHNYQSAVSDLDTLLPMLKAGGIVAVHDCTPWYPGVVRAVRERIFDQPDCFPERELRKSGSYIAWGRKAVTSAPGRQR